MKKCVVWFSMAFAVMSSSAVTPGVWCDNFHSATNYAAAADLPVVLVWGMEGCNHCTTFWADLNSQTALNWAAQQNAVFCHVQGDSSSQDVAPNIGALAFAQGVYGVDSDYQSKTPIIRIYWKGRKSERFTGQISEGSTMSFAQFKAKYENFMSDVRVTASYAAFPMGNTPNDRLEVEYDSSAHTLSAAYIDIPIIRTNRMYATAQTSFSLTVFGQTTTTNLIWGQNEEIKFVRYAYNACTWFAKSIPMTLKDADGTLIDSRTITIVEPRQNSPKNPYWLGEKTADTLTWGDWSMDIDIVTNKVNAWNAAHPTDRAYAMMFVAGSTWCPDCAMAEAHFFTNQLFKTWAMEHKVIFGVLDIPNDPQTANAHPSQLRYETNRTSDDYVTLRGTVAANEDERYQSGAGYLSRHGVAWADAVAVAERNAFLMGHDTLNGGWNRPERTNKNRTGVPILLLLREDGSIAARWNKFATIGPSAFDANYLKRFEEMLSQIDDLQEESDDDKSTTVRLISPEETATSSISAIDQADVYCLSGVEANQIVSFNITGEDSAMVVATLIDGEGGVLASTEGLLSNGLSLQAKLTEEDCYLKVAPKNFDEQTFFDYSSEASTVCAYSIEEFAVMSGGEFGFMVASTNVYENCGALDIAIVRENGNLGTASTRVRLVKAEGTDAANRFVWTDTDFSWADGEDGEKSATLTIIDDSTIKHDMRLTFELMYLGGTAEDVEMKATNLVVNVYDNEFFGQRIYRHLWTVEQRDISGYVAGDEAKIVAGELPEGLAVTVADGVISVSGHVTGPAGEYTVTYAVSGGTYTFEWTVVDYDFAGAVPSLATNVNHRNLMKIEGMALTGLLSLNIPTDGRLSAKYRSNGDEFVYSADGWSAFDEARGEICAVLEEVSVTNPRYVTVTLNKNGGEARFDDPTGEGELVFNLPTGYWTNGAGSYQGQYTVQLPQTNVVDALGNRMTGDGYMAMRMVTEDAIRVGDMLYAGVLPNGRAIYGTAKLLDTGTGCAELPFYHFSDVKSSAYLFTGSFLIAADAEINRQYRWSVGRGLDVVMINPATSYERTCEFNVYGGYYDKDEITVRFEEDFDGRLDSLGFVVTNTTMLSGRYGLTHSMVPVAMEMSSTNIPHIVEGTANEQEVTLQFSPETGVVSGEFYMPLAKQSLAVTYRGIALPGWQGCDSCSSDGTFVTRPWASGSCSFTDKIKSVGSFRNGCAVYIDSYK